MAARIEPDAILPVSTGQVDTPGPVTVEQPADPASTGAVAAPDTTVTTEFGHRGPVSTGTVPTPGPVTTRSPYAEVVRPPQRTEPRTAATAETREQRQPDPQPRAQPQPAPRDDYPGSDGS